MQVTNRTRSIAIALTLMASVRAMTVAFIHRAGDGGIGDPPEAWLMPLWGDALVGGTALVVAWLLWKRPSPSSWVIAISWSAIAAFDALAAYLVDVATPWPDFFMIEIFGRTMFFAAAAMHVAIIGLLAQRPVRESYGVRFSEPAAALA